MQNMHNTMHTSEQKNGRQLSRRQMAAAMLAWAAGPVLGAAPGPVLRVAAASDLKFVLDRVLVQFQQTTGVQVQASYGSSGNFARQIRQGLPAHLFMSADEAWVDLLVEAGRTRQLPDGRPDRGAVYGVGRIVLFVPADSRLGLDPELQGLRAGWAGINRFAIANPEHAPYGRAAQQALQKLGLWERVQERLVLGENIAQATQFITTGAAQAGISALALALAPEVARLGRHVLLPDHLHAPLRQRMVLLRDAPPAAAQLYAYLQTPEVREVFRRYGFEV